MKLILASKSPRRNQILKELGYEFEVVPALKDEVFENENVDEALKKVALSKAREVFKKYSDDCVIGADTIVVFNNRILQKPKSKQEAIDTLTMLSRNTHEVKTGVALCVKGISIVEVVTTKVKFRDLSKKEILDYAEKGTCMDKAGSYGIQEVNFVHSIEGSYSNVVGFPKFKVKEFLEKYFN